MGKKKKKKSKLIRSKHEKIAETIIGNIGKHFSEEEIEHSRQLILKKFPQFKKD